MIDGYWVAQADGPVSAFGSAIEVAGVSGIALSGSVVDLAVSSDSGVWLVGSDGGVFALGFAGFFGSVAQFVSPGGLDSQIMATEPTSSGSGYWLLESDGGIFAFGDAAFTGSYPAVRPAGESAKDWVGLFAAVDGSYVLTSSEGEMSIFGVGSAFFLAPLTATADVVGFLQVDGT